MWQRLYYASFLCLVFSFISCQSQSGQQAYGWISERSVSGKVIRIIDGDTYDLLVDGHQVIRIRMDGIDAPERRMPFYQVSKKYLGSLCYNKNVKVRITGKDRNDRVLGFTYLEDGTELGHEMIRAGLAWHFKKYNSDANLAKLEIEARKSKKGVWQNENPVPPWEIRSMNRKGISTSDALENPSVRKK